VTALCLAGSSENAIGKVFNVGGGEVIRLLDLAVLCCEIFGGGSYVIKEFPEDRKRIDIGDYFADNRLILKELDWTPRLPSGIRCNGSLITTGVGNSITSFKKS
jgi:UDP-glucose 4-epimerase